MLALLANSFMTATLITPWEAARPKDFDGTARPSRRFWRGWL